jgi:hypothetical protein
MLARSPTRTHDTMTLARATLATLVAALLAVVALAGCSGGLPGFGGPKSAQPVAAVDPNLYPSNYRAQIATMLATTLSNRADFQGTLISAPALKPVADSQIQHYVVCLQYSGRVEHKVKVVLFLAGVPTQYVDATPQQCSDAAYQPFTELERQLPNK